MDAEITPEPTDEEREVLLAALAGPDEPADGQRMNASPWRRAGLPGEPEEDGA